MHRPGSLCSVYLGRVFLSDQSNVSQYQIVIRTTVSRFHCYWSRPAVFTAQLRQLEAWLNSSEAIGLGFSSEEEM